MAIITPKNKAMKIKIYTISFSIFIIRLFLKIFLKAINPTLLWEAKEARRGREKNGKCRLADCRKPTPGLAYGKRFGCHYKSFILIILVSGMQKMVFP